MSCWCRCCTQALAGPARPRLWRKAWCVTGSVYGPVRGLALSGRGRRVALASVYRSAGLARLSYGVDVRNIRGRAAGQFSASIRRLDRYRRRVNLVPDFWTSGRLLVVVQTFALITQETAVGRVVKPV